ncbi:class I SAM-dependent methyltransferase [Nocardioides sp. AX2bis]|uniref:class I SAM-dependent methyltransferase n=1 Tax=Nocardioides sp. AX2bis TaxID=2653157 RepID=UPI0012EFD975|nr:class I SAM-dependent methyltransferase [Nocardioides sp. AX2bis]VXA96531.1 hypothetical protein NOCARDAX2BIS_100090 [Nocardioides sp. AX2bis]
MTPDAREPVVDALGRALSDVLGDVTGADVVDLACGDGAVARWLVGAGARSVLALDLDPDALGRARAVAARAGGDQERVLYEQADLEQATLPFEAYDLAWAPGVLATTTDPVRTARMLRAGLRPYARLVATVPATAAGRVVAALGEALLDEVVVTAAAPGAMAPGEVVVTARKPPRRRP